MRHPKKESAHEDRDQDTDASTNPNILFKRVVSHFFQKSEKNGDDQKSLQSFTESHDKAWKVEGKGKHKKYISFKRNI